MCDFFIKSNNFSKACSKIREAIYGIKASSQVSSNQFNFSTGTAFMIAPGILITTAHLCHVENNPTQPRHSNFEVIRAPNVGEKLEKCTFVAEDIERDLALLRIDSPRSTKCVRFSLQKIPVGTPVGSFGFPLAYIDAATGIFRLIERFQGAHISSFHPIITPSGRELYSYETDALMYRGSSGCPGFLSNEKVFGMHNASIIDRPRQVNEREARQEIRLAISLWIPADDIVKFAKSNSIEIET
jgi:S1-C subfamily serine protease